MKRTSIAVVLCAVLLCPAAGARGGQEPRPFDEARELEKQGKERDAFLKYLSAYGCEHAAARLARPKAEKFLQVITRALDGAQIGLKTRATLIRGDLLLATGDKKGALECYRQVVDMIAAQEAREAIPAMRNYYPVQPPRPEYAHRPAMPFTLGPGSHRDNWLIRRFIALEAWDEAAAEFERIRQIHRPAAAKEQFFGLGLQFAIDYSYFLKRRKGPDQALRVLLEPMVRIDIDRNPNLRRPDRRRLRTPFGYVAGVSRKEFIRIAYGAFKTAGKEDDLIAALQAQIEDNDNRARRVLARVRLHRREVDEATALELAYIAAADFDEVTAACRRGFVYQNCKKLAQAAAEYEKALALPYVPPDLPDKDEERVQRQAMAQMSRVALDPKTPAGRAHFQADLLKRLCRLYGALARTDKVLEVTLREYEANPSLLRDFNTVEQAARRFRAAGEEKQFARWVNQRIDGAKDALVRANLCWMIDDHAGAARALASLAAGESFRVYALEYWKDRFRKTGKDKLRLLLKELAKADPKNARARLELLDLEDRFEGKEIIETLELLLEGDASYAFGRGKGVYNRTQFRNYYDLAYRLMRLYEKNGKINKLRGLGLRIASVENPFGKWWKTSESQYRYRDENDLPEDVTACMSLAIRHADKPALNALNKALEQWPDWPPKAQLARRIAGGWKPTPRRAIGWANLPKGAWALACNENVLCLAHDDTHIYAGMPWGVAVYDHEGEAITRVALETAALDLAVMGRRLWVATPRGVYRVDTESRQVGHLPGDQDVSERDRANRRRSEAARDNGAKALAADGDTLWIGTRRDVRRFNTRTGELRIFSMRELHRKHHADCSDIIIDGDYVWAQGYHGVIRYDRKAGTWQPVTYDDKDVHLAGLGRDEVWGHVYLNDELRDRPCLIDRRSLAVTPILLEGNLTRDQRCINGPVLPAGEWQGGLVFRAGGHGYFKLQRDVMKLRRMAYNPPDGFRAFGFLRPSHGYSHYDRLIVDLENFQAPGVPEDVGRYDSRYTSAITLPGGAIVIGKRFDHSVRYQYPSEDWPKAREAWDGEGGLYITLPGKARRRISAVASADSLPGNNVFAVVFDAAHHNWACTDRGVAALDDEGRALRHFTRSDGLCANRVVGGVGCGGRAYFATGWGDHGGGLAVYDPGTSVFTAFFRSDGLATDKLAGVTLEPGGILGRDRLVLKYDVEYMRHSGGENRLHPPGKFDPESLVCKPGGKARIMRRSEARKIMYPGGGPEKRRAMPYLGGFVLSEQKRKGKTYLCGTRGMLVLSGRARGAALKTASIRPRVVFDPEIAQLDEAEKMNIPQPIALEDLKELLLYDNPYVRAGALAAAKGPVSEGNPEYTPLIAKCAADPHRLVRTTAALLLAHSKDNAATEPLRSALPEATPYVRAVVTLALAKRGETPPLSHFEEIFRYCRRAGNIPGDKELEFGSHGRRMNERFSSLREYIEEQLVYRALAPDAGREIFALFLKYPLRFHGPERERITAQLGPSLLKHPEAADVLLSAYESERSERGPVSFARDVFKGAGKDILPVLHKALAGDDRVVCSNAARACGAIGDPSSIPHLIKALSIESGLSRASIVWALGELKAKEALPQLAKLYVDARNDEKRGRGAGFRQMQVQAQVSAQYDSIGDLDSISKDWDELSASQQPELVDPRRNEELLSTKIVLEAVRKIGPGASQGFYRALAAEDDAEGRREAAIRLAEGEQSDAEKNLPILRSLLGDNDITVRMRAAVSLLILGDEAARGPVLEWLDSPRAWENVQILYQLRRVRTADAVSFAIERIKAIASDVSLHRSTCKAAAETMEALGVK